MVWNDRSRKSCMSLIDMRFFSWWIFIAGMCVRGFVKVCESVCVRVREGVCVRVCEGVSVSVWVWGCVCFVCMNVLSVRVCVWGCVCEGVWGCECQCVSVRVCVFCVYACIKCEYYYIRSKMALYECLNARKTIWIQFTIQQMEAVRAYLDVTLYMNKECVRSGTPLLIVPVTKFNKN